MTDYELGDMAGSAPIAADRLGPGMLPSAPESPGDRHLNQALVRAADAAQYAREPIPEEQRGQIRVRLLNATPDPLGSIAALCAQYEGRVVRSLSEVTDEQRRAALADMGKTVLNGPLEAAQFHFQIEGVDRALTHQMVRSRASFFAQESLRFAVPEGRWDEEIALPPSLAGTTKTLSEFMDRDFERDPMTPAEKAADVWRQTLYSIQLGYKDLLELGVPAEEARGILPHAMPTRVHWVTDLRTLLAEAGKRTCTQAQFPWRMVFAGIATALRQYGVGHMRQTLISDPVPGVPQAWVEQPDAWQFKAIADALRPVCYQTGECGFTAKFDRSCKIRERVGALGKEGLGIPSTEWDKEVDLGPPRWDREPVPLGRMVFTSCHDHTGQPGTRPAHLHDIIPGIQSWEWAADPSAARS